MPRKHPKNDAKAAQRELRDAAIRNPTAKQIEKQIKRQARIDARRNHS